MKSSTIASLFALVATALALPAPEAVPEPKFADLETREDTFFNFWTDANYSGDHGLVRNPVNATCSPFTGVFIDHISSAKVDRGLRCILYHDAECRGTNVAIDAPGVADFQTINFNDVASSFQCLYV